MTIDPKNLSATATLTFSDEFDALSLWNGTSGTWTTKYPFAPDKGSTLPSNGEQEWYINAMYAPTNGIKPWTVSNGILTLTAAPASGSTQPLIDGYQYTSGMINTYNTFTQTYGYFEMRAQLPAGQGLWPAFWLLPADMSWPPEIDAMEVLGHDMTTLYTAAHTNVTGSHTSAGGTIKVPDMSAGFHTYGVDWQVDYITYYFDGNEVWKTPTPADLNEPMYMIANLAVGGYWPGMVNGTTPFPAEMKIDYIRAYTDKGVVVPPTTPPPTTPPPTTPPPSTPEPPVSPKLFTLALSAAATTTITGTVHNDTLAGTSAANKIDGRSGGDKMSGGAGDDTYIVDRTTDSITESANSGIDTVQSKVSHTLSANVENLTLTGTAAVTATGNALGNILTSNNAASTLKGGDGNDILVAGKAANILTGGAGSDVFQINAVPNSAGRITDFKQGTDVLDLRDLFSNYHGSNPVTDGYLSFSSDGAGGTRVYFDADGAGGAAKKLVTTLLGVSPSSLVMQSDWFFNGASGTTAPPSPPPPPSAGSSALFTLPTTGTGIDTVSTAAASYTAPTGIENVILGGSAAQTVTGNSLSNLITSNNYGSRIDAGAGNDIIVAGRSFDVLTGGAGSDIFQFNNLPWNNARITDFAVGTDMLDLRALFTAANYQGSNPVADGYLSFASDGAGGTKVYFDSDGTGSGNPWPFLVTTLDNVSPSSLTMQSDWFFSGTAGTTAPPSSPPPPPAGSSALFTLPTTGTGIDTVPTTAASYTAPAGIENVILAGSAAQTVTGNSLNNLITSNNYGSRIDAGAGNDIIVAGRSFDVLTGGAGSDIFQFNNLPWNNARITDFAVGTDMLDLRALFTAANYQGSNPVADGYLSFVSDGAGGTKVYFDSDGTGSGNPWPFLVTTLDNVSPSGLNMQSDWFFH